MNVRALIEDELEQSLEESFVYLDVVAVTDIEVSVVIGSASMSISRSHILSLIGSELSIFAFLVARLIGNVDSEAAHLGYTALKRQIHDIQSMRPRLPPSLAFDIVRPASTDSVLAALNEGKVAVLVGSSSSGKTVIAETVRQTYESMGKDVLWIDCARPGLTAFGILAAILCRHSKPLVVVDDVQSSPAEGGRLFEVWTKCALSANLLVSSWPSASALILGAFPGAHSSMLDGAATVRTISQALSATWEQREEMAKLSAGDALIANLVAAHFASAGEPPSRGEVAQIAYQEILGQRSVAADDVRAIYYIACLGMFEIDVDLSHLPLRIRQTSTDLLARGIFRTRPPFVTIGHRTLARLVVTFLRASQNQDELGPLPAGIAVQYLRSAGPQQTKQTLDRLDLIAVEEDTDQFGASFLAHCWNSLRVLIRYLSIQVQNDPTWGDNVASATFAAEAFSALGLVAEWSETAGYVRGRWTVPNTLEPPVSQPPMTAEADDFFAIREAMRQEDAVDLPVGMIAADDIDVSAFHRTWVLGLLLGFEATAMNIDADRRRDLIACATAVQLPSGAFYPERVPWVTARVIMGLAPLSAQPGASAIVERASRWLRSRRPAGPYAFGKWQPGTGRWNTDLQMTAMALLALGRVGVDSSDAAVRGGVKYLRAGREEWYRPGKEIDCAQAVEAALVLGGSWRDFAEEIRSLLTWAQDINAWSSISRLASDLQDESSKVSAVASSLVTIIWETVRSELPVLFEGVAGAGEAMALEVAAPAWTVNAVQQLQSAEAFCRQCVSERETTVARGGRSTELLTNLQLWRTQLTDVRSALSLVSSRSAAIKEYWDDALSKANESGKAALGAGWRQLP